MPDEAKKSVLDVEPRTRADREFRLAYRSNLGRRIEGERLRAVSDEYLAELLGCCQDDKLRQRIEDIVAAREMSPRRSVWDAIKAFWRL